MLSYRFVSERLENGNIVKRAKIPVKLIGGKANMDFAATLDSGSDVTIIPKAIADFLGVKCDENIVEEKCYGFAKDSFKCVRAKIDIVFKGKEERQSERLNDIPVLVAFVEEEDPVLGCAKIFDNFKITFNGRKKITLQRISPETW